MKTNTDKFKMAYYPYLLDCLKDIDKPSGQTAKEIFSDFWSEFEHNTNYEFYKRKHPNIKDRLSDYLAGVTTNLPYCGDTILRDYMQIFGVNQVSDSRAEAIISGHWQFSAGQILNLKKDLNSGKWDKWLIDNYKD